MMNFNVNDDFPDDVLIELAELLVNNPDSKDVIKKAMKEINNLRIRCQVSQLTVKGESNIDRAHNHFDELDKRIERIEGRVKGLIYAVNTINGVGEDE